MLKTIFLDNTVFHFTKSNLPTLIHGEEGSGASLFTISMLADLYTQGSKIIALTGFTMAHEEFFQETESRDNTHFFTKEKRDNFIDLVKNIQNINEYVILIKNIELVDEEIFNTVKNFNNVIISGDFNNCSFKNKLLQKNFKTKIYFSPLDNNLPELQKYQGYLQASTKSGIVSLEL